MYDELTIPIIHLPLRLYFLLHFVGYAAFLLIGVRLLRRRPGERPHVLLLTAGLLAADTLLAHVAWAVKERGAPAVLDAGAWRFFTPPYWGSPLIFAGLCGVYFLVRRNWPRFAALRERLLRSRSRGILPVKRSTGILPVRTRTGSPCRRTQVGNPCHNELLDVTCIAWAAANVFFKLACFVRGCCGGGPSDWFWCQWFQYRHPTQLYETLVHAALATLLFLLFRRGYLAGCLFIIVGAVFGLARFWLDGLRSDPMFPIEHYSLTQLIAGSVGAACALLLVCMAVHAVITRRRPAVPSSGRQDGGNEPRRDATSTRGRPPAAKESRSLPSALQMARSGERTCRAPAPGNATRQLPSTSAGESCEEMFD